MKISAKGWLRLSFVALLLTGCASVATRPAGLQIEIVPVVLKPGDVVRVKVTAPPGTREVRGRLDLPGSPVLALRSRDGGATWTFTTEIPLTALWRPGKYRVMAEGSAEDGQKLFGETWVTAW